MEEAAQGFQQPTVLHYSSSATYGTASEIARWGIPCKYDEANILAMLEHDELL